MKNYSNALARSREFRKTKTRTHKRRRGNRWRTRARTNWCCRPVGMPLRRSQCSFACCVAHAVAEQCRCRPTWGDAHRRLASSFAIFSSLAIQNSLANNCERPLRQPRRLAARPLVLQTIFSGRLHVRQNRLQWVRLSEDVSTVIDDRPEPDSMPVRRQTSHKCYNSIGFGAGMLYICSALHFHPILSYAACVQRPT